MSLHKFADMVAKQGRGDDSLLIHMTPDEVQRLQQFAQANGRSLTINPTTGLPEAGMLSDLFKAIAPIALGAFLGPAGMGLTIGGLSSAATAGLVTGGITSLATGSLSRGLMAGLGAYGGAGLGESLMTAGGGMSAANAASAAQGQLGAANLALGEALPAQAAEQFTKNAIQGMTPSGAVSAGFNAATASPGAAMDFAKQNFGNIAAAASPIMAGMMVPTTTKLPDPKSTGNIRQMTFNINPDTGKPDPLYGIREMAPVKASEWGDKTFQGQRDLFYKQNQNPYELGVGSLNQPPQQPPRMNTGGIVALAGGGDVQHFAIGDLVKADIDKAYAAGDYAKVNELAQANKITAADVADTYKGFDTSGLAGLGINLFTPPAAPTYNQYSNEQIGKYLTDNPTADIAAATKTTNADPAAVNAYIASLDNPFRGSTETERGSGTLGIYNQMKAQGIDPNELYAASLATDPKYAGWTKDMIQQGYDLDKGMYALSDAKKGVVTDTDWAKLMVGNGTWDKPQYDVNAMAQASGLSKAEVRARFELEKLKAAPVVQPPVVQPPVVLPDPFKSVVPDGYYGSGPATGVDSNGNTVSIATPGDIITNPDGTRTVVPNIPGRPDGGFTGMEQVKSAYTAGGGSLGYTAKAPRTINEFNQLYNKQTGDSLAAYDYLMGKGGGKYPVKSGVPKISENYADFVLGRKATKPVVKTTAVIGTPGQPQTYFDEKAYLAANPDVAAELKTGKSVSGQPVRYTSGYEHYLMYGKAGGRPFTGDYQGYTTAAALANTPVQGGDGNATSATSNTGNTISGFNPAAPDPSIPDVSMSPVSTPAPPAAPPGDDGDGDGDDAVGGYYSRGKLNYRSKDLARGGAAGYAMGGGLGSLGSYSDGGRLLKGPGDGVSDSIPATIGAKNQPARLADGEFVVPARIVSELGNGSTDAGAKKLYAMMDRVQRARGKTTGKNKVAANSRSDKYLPA
jgi:hypothetical protein